MTFGELYRAVAKETEYPAPLIREVLVTSLRLCIEELMSNREKACIAFTGLFNISLGKKRIVSPVRLGSSEKMETYKWYFRFAPSRHLKAVLNDEEDIHDLSIHRIILLYPKEYEAKHGKIDLGQATNIFNEYVPIKYKVIDVNEEKRKELKKKMALEQVNNILEEE